MSTILTDDEPLTRTRDFRQPGPVRTFAKEAVGKRVKPDDIERVSKEQRTSMEMMTVMYRGLSAIRRGEVSEVGAKSMKHLAEQTLEEVQQIALSVEV